MVSKIMSYVVSIIMIILVIGISLQYYVSQYKEPKTLMCHKGKLLVLVDEEGTVYTRVKNVTCEFEKGMLIIEEQS
jgi:uncharacterized protein YpmB